MAPPRSIKRQTRRTSKKETRRKARGFLPESWQAFIARRIVDSIALAFGLVGIFIAAALFSYNHGDPSWNTAADETVEISNWGGAAGAWTADILIQSFGAASIVFAAGFLVWGLRLYRRQRLNPLFLRIPVLFAAAIMFAVAFARIPAGPLNEMVVQDHLGGALGDLIFAKLKAGLSGFEIPRQSAIIAGSGSFIGFMAALYALAVSRDEVLSVIYGARDFIVFVAGTIFGLAAGLIGWVRHYNDEEYEPRRIIPAGLFQFKKSAPRVRQTPRIENEPVSAEISAGPAKSLPGRKAPVIPVVKPQQAAAKAPAAGDNQQRFHLDSEEWDLPELSLLQEAPEPDPSEIPDEGTLRKNAELLISVLNDFNIEGDIVSIHPGPVVTLYELEPAPGTKTARVISLSDDIARSMSAVSVRCAVVPGRNVIGIELPNRVRQTVYMREILSSRLYEKTSAKLPLILGKDISGQPIMADLAKMPHLLVAGTTGSGKSVGINTMILSLLYRLPPEKCRFIMIDPKMLELSVYDDIPHLLSPVVTEPGKAVVALKWTVREMEERYRAMSKLGVRNIQGYNTRIREAIKSGETLMNKVQTGFDPDTGKPIFEDQAINLTELPYIVVVVDEFADLMLVAGKDVENAIQRLAQMARAAGIHLIMATQRPSVDVITGVIKANFPTRISFSVTSKIDSRTILGEGGAEQLLGMGDMLYMAPGGSITRVHGPFVSDKDVENVTNALREQGAPNYIDDVTDGDSGEGSEIMAALFGDRDGGDGDKVDELYDKAVALVAREGKASTSFVQRHLQIGYNRAARIIEEMERQGIISPANATGKREILVRDFSDV